MKKSVTAVTVMPAWSGAALVREPSESGYREAACLRVSLVDRVLGGGVSCYLSVVNNVTKAGGDDVKVRDVHSNGNQFSCQATATGGKPPVESIFQQVAGNYSVIDDGHNFSYQQQ